MTGIDVALVLAENRGEEAALERKARPVAPELGGLKVVRDSQVFEDLRDRSAAAREAGNAPSVLLACLGALAHQRLSSRAQLGISLLGNAVVAGFAIVILRSM